MPLADSQAPPVELLEKPCRVPEAITHSEGRTMDGSATQAAALPLPDTPAPARPMPLHPPFTPADRCMSDVLGESVLSVATDSGLSAAATTAASSPISSPVRCHNPYAAVLRPEHMGLWERELDLFTSAMHADESGSGGSAVYDPIPDDPAYGCYAGQHQHYTATAEWCDADNVGDDFTAFPPYRSSAAPSCYAAAAGYPPHMTGYASTYPMRAGGGSPHHEHHAAAATVTPSHGYHPLLSPAAAATPPAAAPAAAAAAILDYAGLVLPTLRRKVDVAASTGLRGVVRLHHKNRWSGACVDIACAVGDVVLVQRLSRTGQPDQVDCGLVAEILPLAEFEQRVANGTLPPQFPRTLPDVKVLSLLTAEQKLYVAHLEKLEAYLTGEIMDYVTSLPADDPLSTIDVETCEYQFDERMVFVYFRAPRVVKFRALLDVIFKMCGRPVWMHQVDLPTPFASANTSVSSASRAAAAAAEGGAAAGRGGKAPRGSRRGGGKA